MRQCSQCGKSKRASGFRPGDTNCKSCEVVRECLDCGQTKKRDRFRDSRRECRRCEQIANTARRRDASIHPDSVAQNGFAEWELFRQQLRPLPSDMLLRLRESWKQSGTLASERVRVMIEPEAKGAGD